MNGAQSLDRVALEEILHKDRWVQVLSMLRPGEGPAGDLRHSARVLRQRKLRISTADARFLAANDADTRRRLRFLKMLREVRDQYRDRNKKPAIMAGSQEIVSLFPLSEAHLDLYQAMGLGIDIELPATAAAKPSTTVRRRLLSIKHRLPNHRAIAYQEKAAFARYRQALDRAVAHADKVLAKNKTRGNDNPAVRSFRALRTTAQALRKLSR